MWPTTAEPSALSQLSFVAAMAVHTTASTFVDSSTISLKWPNDCLIDGAKFCGILCEVLSPELVAIGIGINIAHVPDDLPYQATKLAKADVESVFEKLQLNLSNYLAIWNSGKGFDAIRRLWLARCPHLGKAISVDGISGIFEGLGPDGALLLGLTDGTQKAVYAGDMRLEYATKL